VLKKAQNQGLDLKKPQLSGLLHDRQQGYSAAS